MIVMEKMVVIMQPRSVVVTMAVAVARVVMGV